MILSAWRRSWLAYAFDRETAGYARRLVRLGEHLPISGFGAVEKTREHGRTFFALYRWGRQIWFQAGQHRWRLDAVGLQLGYRVLPGGRSSEFTVRAGDDLAYHCTYGHRLRSLFNRGERAGDTVDLETGHFLAHVAGQPLPLGDSDAWYDGEASIKRETAADVRHAIREHLALLADSERQRAFERRAQIADVPAELLSAWFDDLYHPDRLLFQRALSPSEREALRRFNAILEGAAVELAEVTRLDELQARPIWTQVGQEAAETLRRLPEAVGT
jgi:hypothetical protein